MLTSPATQLRQGMEEHVRKTQEVLARTDYAAVGRLIEKLYEAYERRKRVFLFGNGGSAACASHFAEDLAKGILKDLNGQKRLRVLSLTDSVPFISALGNDCGYESIFREQLATHAEAGDIAIGISGSGNSPNVLKAMEWARQNGIYTVGLTGFNGGKLKGLVDLSIHYEVPDMEIAENAHLIVLHLVVGGLRRLVNR
ncbi:MAG: SIS domain-containing protein [Planctomycetes bacterium]|nr:SIS domain-containing protein [Planctomycetota bacterium]